MPIYKSNVSADEDFGLPPGINLTDCPVCYDAATRTKFMGECVGWVQHTGRQGEGGRAAHHYRPSWTLHSFLSFAFGCVLWLMRLIEVARASLKRCSRL